MLYEVLLFPKTDEAETSKDNLLRGCYGLFGAKKILDNSNYFLIRIQSRVPAHKRIVNLHLGEIPHEHELYQYKFYNMVTKKLEDGAFEYFDHSVVPFGCLDEIFGDRDDLLHDVKAESDSDTFYDDDTETDEKEQERIMSGDERDSKLRKL